MTREEHLVWCKQRALEYLDDGDLQSAVASMGSDLSKHPETAGSHNGPLLMLAMSHLIAGDVAAVRRWIEGFN